MIADQTGSGGTGANAGRWNLEKDGAGTLTLAASNRFSGNVVFDEGILRLSAANAAGKGSIFFGSGPQTLVLDNAALPSNAFGNTIVGFSPGDVIDLGGYAFSNGAKVVYHSSTGALVLNGPGGTVSFTVKYDSAIDFFARADGQGGTEIVLAAAKTVTGTGGDETLGVHGGLGAPASHVSLVLLGRGGEDHLNGGSRPDHLDGGKGQDILRGGAGDDLLFGGPGADRLDGGKGRDTLDGGGGGDVLIGRGGADTFLFSHFNANSDPARIVDFKPGVDVIALSAKGFGAIGPVLTPDEFHVGAKAADASDRLLYNPGTGALLYDSDGAGGHRAVEFAMLAKHLHIDAGDFIVV